jgi:flagellar motility protein MotE (MotC chaperone)
MSQKRTLVDPIHLFDERGNALSSYDVQAERIRDLEAENARLKAHLERVNGILARSRAANLVKPPPRLH